MGKLSKIWDLAMESIFPSNIYCICCGSLIDKNRIYSLCDSCSTSIHWINGKACEICGKELPHNYHGARCYNCMVREHAFLRGCSTMTYGLMERQMILDYKYNGKGYMGIYFGDMLTDKLTSLVFPVECVVPVPIHKSRERSRGYNQTAIMAKRLCYNTGLNYRERGLVRIKETTLLRSMSPLERENTMRDAFAVTEYEKQYIDGMSILLVDDIITTGATADACAKTLLEGGAREVYLITLAAGGNKKPTE